jgi:segregation and condensation protein A
MLLPQEASKEDEDELGDPRAELVRKLLEYQAFKEAAKGLGFLEDERGKMMTRQVADYYLPGVSLEEAGFEPLSVNLYDLLSAFQRLLARFGPEPVHEVFEEIISIEEKMGEIKILFDQKKRVAFSTLFGKSWSRNLLIVTFLAILELVRTRFARVVQTSPFEDFVIEKNS